jgi:chromosomal replication initiation ATPase DnaA
MTSSTIRSDRIGSVILHGPPGVGKTTLAEIIARETRRRFVELSATASGVKEVREVLDAARRRLEDDGQRTCLFVDEIQLFVDANRWPPELAKVIQTGRRYELDLLLCSQQVNELHNRLRQQLTEVVTFRQQDPRALEWLQQAGPVDPVAVSALQPGEFLAWQRAIDKYGLAGLRTTRVQQYRN